MDWVLPTTNPFAVAYTKLYRALTSDFNAANLLADVVDNRYYDKQESSTRFYYWIRFVSVNGTPGELIGPASAVAKPTIERLIELLTGEIDDGFLAQSLKTQIDRIQTIALDLAGEVVSRENGETTLAEAMADVNAGVAQALTFLANEQSSRVTADSVLADSINLIAVTWNGNLAAVQQTLHAEITAVDGRVDTVASSVTQVAAQAADNLALVNTALRAEITEVDGRVTTLASRIDTVQAGGANLIVNSSFIPGNGGGWNPTEIHRYDDAGVPANAPSDYVLRTNNRDTIAPSLIRVTPGEVIDASVWLTCAAASPITAGVWLQMLDAANTAYYTPIAVAPSGFSGWVLAKGSVVIPAGIVAFRVDLQTDQAPGGPNFIYFSRPTVVKRDASGLVAMAAVQNEITARTDQYGALAAALTTVETEAANHLAQAQLALTTSINAVDGKASALFEAKVNVDGLIGGFGLYNNGSLVEAGFDVDRFWIGRTQANKRKPFIIDGGVVYIDEAAINKLVFTKLRDESGSFIVQDGKVKAQYMRVASLDALSANIGLLRTRSSGARMELADDVLRTFDDSNTVRIKFGNLA